MIPILTDDTAKSVKSKADVLKDEFDDVVDVEDVVEDEDVEDVEDIEEIGVEAE